MEKNVLVLHQSDELKIIALQNELCLLFHGKAGVFKKYPLWVELPENLSAKEIAGVHFDNIFINENGVFLSVLIKTESEIEISGFLQLILFKNKEKITETLKKEFQLDCRIFRVALGHFENNRYWLTDSLWKKLKK
ncbi:MAG: hypothetical protein KIG91_08975 [Treponema sp.]|nr:hypothetical protein [Treponema sp.]